MPCLLHQIGTRQRPEIAQNAEKIGQAIIWDVPVAYAMAMDNAHMECMDLVADKVKEICEASGLERCDEYDMNLLFSNEVLVMSQLEMLSWIYHLFCEVNMNTEANKLADWVESLS